MLARLRLHRIVCRHDQHGQVDARGSGQHLAGQVQHDNGRGELLGQRAELSLCLRGQHSILQVLDEWLAVDFYFIVKGKAEIGFDVPLENVEAICAALEKYRTTYQ